MSAAQWVFWALAAVAVADLVLVAVLFAMFVKDGQ